MSGMCTECGLALVSRGEVLQTQSGAMELFVCRNPVCGLYGKMPPTGGTLAEARPARRLGSDEDRQTADARAEYVKRRMVQKRR